MIDHPASSEYAPFYADYVARMPEPDALPALESQVDEVESLLLQVPASREAFAYAPGKWTIRQVAGHLIDGERVFGFRLFCFARGDRNPLPGFEENEYVERSDYTRLALRDLVSEWKLVRESNLRFVRRLDDVALRRIGTAAGSPVSVRALARMLGGHVRHHAAVLMERYGLERRG